MNRKRATCAKWKWTKYRCKHSTVWVSIYDAPSYISPISWSSLQTLLRSRHTYMAAQSVNLRFVVHIPSPNPSSHARAHVCATFCSKILRSLESIKSPQNIVSYFSCTLWRLQACVWVLARIYMATVMSKEIIRFLKTFISTIIFCTLKINIIPNLFVNLRFPHSWQYYVLLRI